MRRAHFMGTTALNSHLATGPWARGEACMVAQDALHVAISRVLWAHYGLGA